MQRILGTLVALVTAITPALGFAKFDQQLMKNRMVNDLEIIKNCFDVSYAPADWKKSYCQWDLNQAISIAQVQVLAPEKITVKKFQQIVKKFFLSTRDYHVSVRFCKTSAAFLPFRVRGAEGRYFISKLDSDSPQSLCIGDEILTFDGRPIQEVIDEIKERDLSGSDSKTDQALAEIYLTTRVGALGHDVPSGPISITTKSRLFYYDQEGEDNYIAQYDLEWEFLPEEVTDGPYQEALQDALAVLKLPTPLTMDNLAEEDYFAKQMVAGFHNPLMRAFERLYERKLDEDNKPIGHKKCTMPPIGRVIWEADADNPFHAYIAETPKGHTIGYIRLSSYYDFAESAQEFSKLINKFQSKCEALVLDQQNNGGGLAFFMYAIAAMLSDTPMKVPTHRLTITQNDAFLALAALDLLNAIANDQETLDAIGTDMTIFGYPVDKELILCFISHFNFILQEWNAGQTLTSAAPLYGIDALKPHPWGTFNKPILVLVNELDFSAADFLPAILQDNKRATVMGTKTAGAGGYVISHSFPNRFGIEEFRLTGSLGERIDMNPIENLGVTPDIPCELTVKDLTCGYVDFCTKVQAAVDAMLEQKQQ